MTKKKVILSEGIVKRQPPVNQRLLGGKRHYTCLDLFCGCGGLSKGMELAGFEIIGGIDFNEPAIETYQHNFPKAKALCRNLMEMDDSEIKKTFPVSEIDAIVGGPPCQGFSSANRWADEEVKDPRNRLFFQFVKFVDLFKPKLVLIENVPGILTKDGGYAARRIDGIFSSRGYHVSNRILNAAMFGVPQRRLRNFFVMSTFASFDFDCIRPKAHCPTVREAIEELYELMANPEGTAIRFPKPPDTPYRKYLRARDWTTFNHDVRFPAEKVQRRISFVPQGGNWRDVPPELWPRKRNNRHSSAFKRLREDDVSVTIDTGNNHSNYFHPRFNRLPTVREAARIQSFPDSFRFFGNRSEQYRQVGNAVPPLLAKAIADKLVEVLNENR